MGGQGCYFCEALATGPSVSGWMFARAGARAKVRCCNACLERYRLERAPMRERFPDGKAAAE